MYFIAYCKDRPGNLRAKLRADHLRHIIANPRPYRFGGPLLDERGGTVGSVLIFEVADRAELDRILDADPYFHGGLYQSVEIHGTRQVIPETAPGLLDRELSNELAKQQGKTG